MPKKKRKKYLQVFDINDNLRIVVNGLDFEFTEYQIDMLCIRLSNLFDEIKKGE